MKTSYAAAGQHCTPGATASVSAIYSIGFEGVSLVFLEYLSILVSSELLLHCVTSSANRILSTYSLAFTPSFHASCTVSSSSSILMCSCSSSSEACNVSDSIPIVHHLSTSPIRYTTLECDIYADQAHFVSSPL